MELIDKKQVAAFKRLGRRLGGDPARLRMTVCVLLAGIGVFGVERPLGMRLAHARDDYLAAKKSSQMAEEVAFFTRERKGYEERASVSSDLTDWQNYVLERLRCTTATLISLEPHKALAKGVFTVLEMEVVAKGKSYREFADFIDRIEHGERLVRVEKLRMEKQQASIYMTCLIRGLVKGSGKSAAGATKTPGTDANLFVGPLQAGSQPASEEAGPANPDAANDAATEAATDSAANSASDATEPGLDATDGAEPAAEPVQDSLPEPDADAAPSETPDESSAETHDA